MLRTSETRRNIAPSGLPRHIEHVEGEMSRTVIFRKKPITSGGNYNQTSYNNECIGVDKLEFCIPGLGFK